MKRLLPFLIGALLVANILVFAYSRGWLGGQPGSTQREPERLAAQHKPEEVQLLSPEAASAALKPLECRDIGPFNDEASLAAAEAALVSQLRLAPEQWQRRERHTPGQWVLATGTASNAADLARRKQALDRADITPQGQRALLGEAQASWILDRFDSEAQAREALRQRSAQGLRGLRVVVLRLPSHNWMLRVPGATTEQTKATHPAWPGGLRECEKS